MKFLARKGAIGGTVRWAVANYKVIRTANPTATDPDIFRHMIIMRLSVLPDSGHFAYMESFLNNPTAGLQHILMGLIRVECGFTEALSLPTYVREVIKEELAKADLPASVVLGPPEHCSLTLVPTLQKQPTSLQSQPSHINIAELLKMISRGSYAERLAAIESLDRSADPGAEAAIRTALADNDPTVREAARQALDRRFRSGPHENA